MNEKNLHLTPEEAAEIAAAEREDEQNGPVIWTDTDDRRVDALMAEFFPGI